MRLHHRPRRLRQRRRGAGGAQAEQAHVGAVHQQEEAAGQGGRILVAGLCAKGGDAGQLLFVELGDDLAGGVVRLGEFHAGVADGAAAGVAGAGLVGLAVEKGLQGGAGVAGMPGDDLVKPVPVLADGFPQVFGDQLVLAGERAIEAHLGGLGLAGDALHAHGADAVLVEKLPGGVEDAVSRARAGGRRRMTFLFL